MTFVSKEVGLQMVTFRSWDEAKWMFIGGKQAMEDLRRYEIIVHNMKAQKVLCLQVPSVNLFDEYYLFVACGAWMPRRYFDFEKSRQ